MLARLPYLLAFLILWPLAAAAGSRADNPLIDIAGGRFVFGSDDGEDNERPRQYREIAPFRITKFEITNRQYKAFVAAANHRPSFYGGHPVLGLPDHPVVGVSWADADAFCRFHGMTLPTEQQWERAARGAEGRRYAWGDQPPAPERVNRGAAQCCGPDEADGYPLTAPVGRYPSGMTPEGVADMTGNVWEWVEAWYNPYDAAPAARAERFRVLRGGAWNSDAWRLRTTYRLAYDGDYRFAANGGFRCVAR
ncbi:MAG: formylglycine-generating enzyme family protein [Kiloniellaceae bacterium]